MNRAPHRFGLAGCLLWLVALAIPALAHAEAPRSIRRFALVVGVNDGGKGRAPLRYAHADADAVARVLRQLGGVEASDLSVEKEPNRRKLEESLEGMKQRLAAASSQAGRRVELLFYYSGHSDEEGLLLGGERLEYRRLRNALDGLPASIRIAVLDSCASGALTRGKGGKRRAPFLVDRSSDVRGHAFLTSASSTETAQESDRMRGSFFTHFLVAGLRGAADINRDGRVTLNEAYNHAFHETLARTESTRSGPQHPNYDMQLAGSGDLVMTDLRGTSALMVLAPELRGRLFIRDAAGRLVAELGKVGGHPVTLGLEPGRYQITLEHERQVRRGQVTLAKDQQTVVRPATLGIAVALESTRGRGADPALAAQAHGPVVRRPVSVSFAPGLSNNAGGGPFLNHFSFNFTVERADLLSGFEVSTVGSIRSLDVAGLQVGGAFHVVRGELRGLQVSGAVGTASAGAWGMQIAGAVSWSGPCHGIQIAPALNRAGGRLGGLQLGGAVNLAGETDGGQLGMGLNLASGRLRGLQIGGGANLVRGPATGLQIAGALNSSGPMLGLQIGGALNRAERAAGSQIAGALNLTGSLGGLQVAPINLAEEMRGLQIGLINLAGRARGLQIGLINLAREDRGLVPIGLLNLVGDGVFAPSFWTSGSSLFNVGFKLGGRHVYGVLGFGVHPGEKQDRRLSMLGGVGGHVPLSERFFLDLDVVLQQMAADYRKTDELDLSAALRVSAGFRLLPQLSLFAGPTLEVMASRVRERLGYTLRLWHERREGGTEVELGLGFVVGVQFTPRLGRLNQPARSTASSRSSSASVL